MIATIHERVLRGAVFLDEHDAPDWWSSHPADGRAINLEALRLDDSDNCLLGQRCPPKARKGPWSPFYQWAVRLWGLDGYHEQAEAHGFALALTGPAEMDDLHAEWKRHIQARRQQREAGEQ